MSGAAKVGKVEKTQAAKVSRLQKEVERIQKENDSLKALVKQKNARVAVLSAGFDSSSIQQNVVEAFDMENMFRQAAIDAQEHVERLLKTVQVKPEEFEEVKATLDRTRSELIAARKEITHTEKQLKFKTKECESLLEEKRNLILKTQSMPTADDFRTLEQNYRSRLIALKDELKQKNFIIEQCTNKLPNIFSKSHNSDEYQLLEEKFQEASKTIESLSCVLKENEYLKENTLKLEKEKEELRECIRGTEEEINTMKQKLHDHEQFERSLPPDAKTAVVLQEELVAKDLALKRQHDDFVKQLNEMNGTVTYLRLQYDKHMCVLNELERKKKEIVQLQEEARKATATIEDKDQQIKHLENHFDIRRSGLHHTVAGLERKIKSSQQELNESKRTIVKLLEENKKLTSKCLQTDNSKTIQFGKSESSKDPTVDIEYYKQQLLEEKQKLREEKNACQSALEKLVAKEKEAQSKQQTQRILLERKDRTIKELRKLTLSTD